ncbi:hypothetical protein Poli38472_014729 [Pythium oligandrum]|uniref:Uncharacterized protein n=1 Tax=Pythium oligandrum TaxID=41045 RepID=A0A8K1FDK3_PYTOL|nr:hypothetical protein Poli38472_014729 [Pythium oligandrum]|eukprot:TMW54958.1 hypothetical protein Poli38472_014729 [Pythium oligandrum]
MADTALLVHAEPSPPLPNASHEGGVVETVVQASQSQDEQAVDQVLASVQDKLSDGEIRALLNASVENGWKTLFKGLLQREFHMQLSEAIQFSQELLVSLVREGDADLLELFLKAAPSEIDVNSVDTTNQPLLLVAVEQDNTALVRVLLQAGATTPICDVERRITPLHLATEWNSVEMLRLLINAGADIDACTVEGDTPLHTASQNGHMESAECLLQEGADVHKTNATGECPLHVAAREGHTEMVKLLLRHGADVHACDRTGRTPLHVAAFFDESAARFASGEQDTQVGVLKSLLAYGASLESRDGQGNSVLRIAKTHRFDVIVNFVRTHHEASGNAKPKRRRAQA